MRRFIYGFIMYFIFSGVIFAVNTELWETKEFSKCKFTNVMLDESGAIHVAPEIREVWKNPELYIWSILGVGSNIYIGTGGSGKIYKIPGSGTKAEVLLDTKQAGIFSLAEYKGKIYAGTSPDGIIYLIDKDGKSRIFAETGEKYIWKIIIVDNTLYVATGTEGRIVKIAQDGKIDTFYTTSEMNITFLDWFNGNFYAGTGENGYVFKIDKSGKGICIFDASEKEIKTIIPSDTLLLVAATGDSAGSIYSITRDNRVEKIWSVKSLIRGFEITEGEIFASAGNRVYKIRDDGSFAIIAEMPTNISCTKGKFVCTSEVGKLYRISGNFAPEGIVESDAFDTYGISEWGRLEYDGAGEPEFFTRSGNVEATDLNDKAVKAWSDWSSIAGTGNVKSPNARFIQWKAVLKGTDRLENVRLAYLPQNQRPEIASIAVTKRLNRDSIRRIIWSVRDPNNDSLIFTLYFKLVDEINWSLLKGSLKDSSYEVDPTVFPDGKYEFKVISSDELSNPEEMALSSERVSLVELIDNTAPEIKDINISGCELRFSAVDEFNYIKSCDYAIDGGEWRMIFPVDGLFDSRGEKFLVDIKGAHRVVMRVSDYFGNTALKSELVK